MGKELIKPSDIYSKDEALKNHLLESAPVNGISFFSGFTAALKDARNATNRDSDGNKLPGEPHGSWLGAIGYMILLDQIGSSFSSNSPRCKNGSGFKRALSCFTTLPDEEINALYALRCAFAHDYSLHNINNGSPDLTHHFVVDANSTGPLVKMPKARWDGNILQKRNETTTLVNLQALGDLVEAICYELRKSALDHELEINLNQGIDELMYRYSIFTFVKE